MASTPALIGVTRKQPPTAPGLPLLDNAKDLLVNPLAFFLESYLALGPAFRAGGPGRRYTVLAGPRANDFLLHGAERYLDHKPLYRQLASQLKSEHYPIATDGARHRHLRQTLKTAFNAESLAHYTPSMLTIADQLVRSWQPGQRLRVLDTMHALVGEQLGLAMANTPLGSMLPDAVTFARFSVGAGLGAYPTFMANFPNYQQAKRRMLAFMAEVVAAHRANPPVTHRQADFVDLLLNATDEEGRPLGDEDIIANAQMIYSNSLLYGAPACAFLLYGLLKYPEARARVQAEVDATFAQGQPDYQTLSRLPALRGSLLESMRMFPIALATPRMVTDPFEFEGYTIEAGEAVLFAVTVCHFLPELWREPQAFDIDRFAEPRNEPGQPGMFVRFGLGAHACIGASLVELLMATTVATILRQVDLRLTPANYTLRRVVNPFPEPEGKFAVRVTRRRVGGNRQ